MCSWRLALWFLKISLSSRASSRAMAALWSARTMRVHRGAAAQRQAPRRRHAAASRVQGLVGRRRAVFLAGPRRFAPADQLDCGAPPGLPQDRRDPQRVPADRESRAAVRGLADRCACLGRNSPARRRAERPRGRARRSPPQRRAHPVPSRHNAGKILARSSRDSRPRRLISERAHEARRGS